MKSRGSSQELLVLLFLICSINAAVINLKQGETCADVCIGKENIFKYEENKIYVYNFISKHSIKNPNAKEETLQLELQGKAQISKITACDFGLLLSDVKLKESLKEKSTMSKDYEMMKTMLEKYSLRFGFDDGRVTGVCPDNMDNEFAVNIKRGILSSLQVSIDSLDIPNYLTETDIAGECITEYIPRAELPNFVKITKKKSIAGCSRKSKYFTTITGRIYDKPKESRNMALLDGEYKCEITIKVPEGLKESICEEKHIFKPFRSETEGSTIIINQELRFDSIKDGKISAKAPNTRSDLTMNHGDRKPLHMTQKLAKPQPIIQEICGLVKGSVQSTKVTELFVNLIRSMGESSYEEIKSLEKFISDDASCKDGKIKTKNILIDALTNVKTDAAFKFLIEDAKIYKLSKLGLSIFDNPTATMIATLTKKLDEPTSFNSVTTILSSMIKSYCDKTPGCMLNPDIINAMTGITKILGSNCESSDKNVLTKILYSLRAIGNVGSHPNLKAITRIIEACAMKDSNDDDVQVLSVHAVRQFPCDDDVDTFLWTIFKNVAMSSELRIEAYLSLVRCPNKDTFHKIIGQLIIEKSQQLGSFVWSHIANLMETADRFKIDQRDMLQTFANPMASLEKVFNLDFRSYSKNIEKTYQRGYSAAKMDTNIIFSSSSPIPSSVTVNTTIDFFGRSINLFEIGIRGKGISDKIFGNIIKPKAHAGLHPGIVKMDQTINKPADKLSVSLYTRLMGREIYFNPNIISDLIDAMMKASKTSSFERSLLLLDLTVSVASISGFPIELQIESAATVDMSMMKNNPMQLTDMELSSKINYGIQVTGKLLVNAHCTKIGVQSKGLLSRDMEFGGKLKLKDSPDLNDYQFEINKMPDNSKLFSISNELSLIHKLEKVEMIKPYETRMEKCSGEGMLKIMGVKVCLSLKAAPKFSSYLSNIKADVTIEKFSGLNIQWKREYVLKPVKKLKSLLVSISFPGANEDTFRLKVERDSKLKSQSYEMLLWQKWIYLKFDINDKKITGNLKSGNTEATLSGLYEEKGMLKTEMNVDIKSDKDSGKLYFSQKLTKGGPEITLKLTKNGDSRFNLVSKTTLQVSEHKIFTKFERFRHSTVLKYSGDNEMSFIIERSKGNNPPTEIKSKIELFWKTKTKRNFFISQNYLWQQNKNEDYNSDFFGKVTGTKWIMNMDHEIEVKDKKFNITNNLEYFISNNFYATSQKPKLIYFKFKREDLFKKEIVLEASTMFGMDLSNFEDVKILLESLLNYRNGKFARKLNSKVTWKMNKLYMFDIDAELTYSKFLELYFKHKFTTTQKGSSSIEIKIVDDSYKISSELNLPKNHVLTIEWPKNVIKIDSDVDCKSLSPFDLVVNHNLKLNNELLAKITNTAKYNERTKDLKMSSIAKSGKDVNIYSMNLERKVDYSFSKTRVFYDYLSNTSLTIPRFNIDHRFIVEQFADIDMDGKIQIKKKTFTSKIVVQEMTASNKKFGYEVILTKKQDSVPYKKLKSVVFTGVEEHSSVIKWGREGYNTLFGVTVDLKNKITSEMMFKLNLKGKTVNMSMFTLVDVKNSPDYNWYIKRNAVMNWEKENMFSAKWTGVYGKSKMDANRMSYDSLLTLEHKGWKNVDINFNINCQNSCLTLANANYILSYNFENKEPDSFTASFKNILKWQKTGSRTSNYYDLQINEIFDKKFKKLDFDLTLTKDSNVDKILFVKAFGVYGKNGELSVNVREQFAKLIMTMNVENEIKLSLTSSNALLKELTVALDNKMIEKTVTMSGNLALNSNEKNYKLTFSRLQKKDYQNRIDLVENIKWNSNIPYIKSGDTMLGVLVQSKNVQCNLNINYDQKKMIDLKIDTSDISKALKVMLETNMKENLKFITSYKKNEAKFEFDLEFKYGEKYFKISKMEMSNKINGIFHECSANVLIQTSSNSLKDVSFSSNRKVDYNNILKTYKSDLKLTVNGNTLLSQNIDLPNGKVHLKDLLVQYFTALNIKSYEVTGQYKIQSIRDFMVEYKLMVDDKSYSELNLEYFRMAKNENAKNIDVLGDALFYLNMEVKRPTCSGKLKLFINKEKTSGLVKMQSDMPLINMKFDEVTMTFKDIKDSAGSYTGNVNYKGSDYTFTYKVSEGYKREFQMIAKSKDSTPKQVDFAFDFTNNYIFKISFDKYFLVDLSFFSADKTNYFGKILFAYKEKNIVNLDSKFKVTIPKDVTTATDFIRTLLGLKGTINLKFLINGNILSKFMKVDVRLFHLHSDRYSKGTNSYNLVSIEIKDDSVINYTMMVSFDRNLPDFKYEDYVLIKKDMVTICKNSMRIMRGSNGKFDVEGNINIKDFTLQSLAKNDDKMIHSYVIYKAGSSQKGLGFQAMKENYDASLFYSNPSINVTCATNLGYILKVVKNRENSQIWPVGKSYYMSALDTETGSKVKVQLTRKNTMAGEFLFDYDMLNWKSMVTINVFDERSTKETLGFVIKYNGSHPDVKNFVFKSDAKLSSPLNQITLTSNLMVNKNNKADLTLKISSTEGKSPYVIDIKYKGTYIITATATLDTRKIKFGHSLLVKDGKMKTELWSCSSKCSIKSEFDCYFLQSNKARDIKLAMIWKKKINLLEVSWNKKKEQGFLISCERKEKKTIVTLSSPLRTVQLTRIATSEKGLKKRQLTLEVTRKADPSKPVNFNVDISMKGTIKADYNLDISFNSNLLQKGINLSINRQLKRSSEELYYLNVKSSFHGEDKPFFTLNGNLLKRSKNSYEMKMDLTNYDKFLNFSSAATFKFEEFSLEYKLIRNENKERELLFQYMPFKKFLLTNNKDFKIMFSRTVYQYGYRRDIVLNLGKKGPKISAYSTLIKSPFKYNLDISTNGKKLVVDFRPVGNLFIGDIYRKIDGIKVQDLKLTISFDPKSIMTTNIYWNPKFIETLKTCVRDTLNPDNLKSLMVDSYQNSENHIASFTSNIKTKIAKNMNVQNSLDFVKGIASDAENVPTAFAVSYDDDDWYMKTMMDKWRSYLQNRDISTGFEKAKNTVKMTSESLSKTLYIWCVEAKWYSIIYDPIKNTLNSLTYNHIKDVIDGVVTVGKYMVKCIDSQITTIGNKLESLSERVASFSSSATKLKDNVVSNFKGSTVGRMIELLMEVRDTMIEGLGQVVETEFIKQRIIYYKTTLTNMKELMVMTRNMTKEMMNYIKTSNVVGNIVDTIKLIKSMKYKEAFVNMMKPEEAKFQMDLEKGTMEIKVYVPPMTRPVYMMLKTMYNMFPTQVFSQMRGSGLGGKLLSLFYRYEYLAFNYRTMKSLRKLLPPFKKSAWVLGGNSILTYDGSSIRIGSGKCSYLLARDTRIGSFSLVMHIKSGEEKKEFELSYIKKITLLSSGMVNVDGKALETLPKVISDDMGKRIEIYRDHDMTKIITSEGLTIEYFNNLDYLKVTLTGNWHGKVKGLLGSNDFDAINDWTTSSGEITHDAGILSKSWSIDVCNSQTKTGLYSVRVNPKHLDACVDLFRRDSISYLSRCFTLISPEPYYELCRMALQYKEMTEKDFDAHICNLSRNYVVRCKNKGMMIRLKKSCIKCGKDKSATEFTKELSRKNPKFSYIFIIENSKCLIPYKGLVKTLYNVMSLEKDNLYTLLSYNGRGIFKDSHFKSFNNEITVESKSFGALLTELESSATFSEHTSNNTITEGSQAIFDAIKMPSKSGYIEKIVFIGCSSCGENKKHIFSNLAGLLKYHGISLTYLTAQPFTGPGSNANIAGFGNNLVFTFDNDKLNSNTWAKDLQPPADVCSSLAQIHGGFVWSLNSMISEMRQRRVSETLHAELKKVSGNMVPKQKCSCGIGNYEEGKVECKVSGLV